MVSLYDPSKQQYHTIGLNSEDREELRGAMVDYLLMGDFTHEERVAIASADVADLVIVAGLTIVHWDHTITPIVLIPPKYTNIIIE